MDYKKKLRSRLNVAITYIVLGVMFIVGTFITKTLELHILYDLINEVTYVFLC